MRCPTCHRAIRPSDVEQASAGGFVHRTARAMHPIPPEIVRAVQARDFIGRGQAAQKAVDDVIASVQNSKPRRSLGPSSRRRRVSNKRPSRKGIGGRPLAFIPALVVAEASRLYQSHRRWSAVLEELRRGGNGSYARNTLIRRVSKYSAGQYSDLIRGRRGRRRAARAASETRPCRVCGGSGLVPGKHYATDACEACHGRGSHRA